MKQKTPSFQSRFDPSVWKIVANIPKGQVMSYGEVAAAAGHPRHARMVSRALTRSPQPIPWHRVVRGNRTLAFAEGSTNYYRQASLLQKEGVSVKGRVVHPVPIKETLDALLWAPQ